MLSYHARPSALRSGWHTSSYSTCRTPWRSPCVHLPSPSYPSLLSPRCRPVAGWRPGEGQETNPRAQNPWAQRRLRRPPLRRQTQGRRRRLRPHRTTRQSRQRIRPGRHQSNEIEHGRSIHPGVNNDCLVEHASHPDAAPWPSPITGRQLADCRIVRRAIALNASTSIGVSSDNAGRTWPVITARMLYRIHSQRPPVSRHDAATSRGDNELRSGAVHQSDECTSSQNHPRWRRSRIVFLLLRSHGSLLGTPLALPAPRARSRRCPLPPTSLAHRPAPCRSSWPSHC